MNLEKKRAAYENFIAKIDATIAGKDEYGDLRWHVACTAETNASDTAPFNTERWYEVALDSARMAYEDWSNWYPSLRR